jgi:soluble lytic murein transglycosylase-like protein
MRKGLAKLICLASLLPGATALAGEQRYEPLSASVRAALHHSVADTASPRLAFADEMDGAVWLADMSLRMKKYIANDEARRDFLVSVHYEATRAGLDPQLVLAVAEVESGFRKYAISKAGARGYMQVMPFWVNLIGEDGHNLFKLRTNLRYGCTILRHYLDMERGNLVRALGRYNGALGKSSYPNRVQRALARNWRYDPDAPTVTRAAAQKPVPAGPPKVIW